MPIRLLLVDDHPIVLHGLRQLFGSRPEFDVLDGCVDGVSAIDAVRRHHPDVLVADLRMAGMSGLEMLHALSTQGLSCRTILLTAAVQDHEVAEARRLGAMGVVLKDVSPDVLVDCVSRVHRGEPWVGRESVAGALDAVPEREAAAMDAAVALTPREVEIVKMVVTGLRNKAIAERLAITEGTVKVHLHNIYNKFGVDGRIELILCAQQKGLT